MSAPVLPFNLVNPNLKSTSKSTATSPIVDLSVIGPTPVATSPSKSPTTSPIAEIPAIGTPVFLVLLPTYGRRGCRYDVRLGAPDGEVIVAGSVVPFCDAARVLHARGLRGRVELWDSERSFARMTGAIEKLARITVEESETISPRFVRWKPFPARRYEPKTAKSVRPLPPPSPEQPAAGERRASHA